MLNLNQLGKLQALKHHMEDFQNDHPKFHAFVNAVYENGLKEGSIIEINVTDPEGKNYVSNIKLTEKDIDFLHDLQELRNLR